MGPGALLDRPRGSTAMEFLLIVVIFTAFLMAWNARKRIASLQLQIETVLARMGQLEDDLERLRIDPAAIERRAATIREAGPELVEKVRRVFGGERMRDTPVDVDASLYDALIGDGDKRLFAQVRTTPPEALGQRDFGFRDARLPELLFRYRARNWPHTLTPEEHARWDEYRRQRLFTESGLSEYSFARFGAEIAALRVQNADVGSRLVLLDQLEAWGRDIAAGLN